MEFKFEFWGKKITTENNTRVMNNRSNSTLGLKLQRPQSQRRAGFSNTFIFDFDLTPNIG